jgi:hypothetical protein
MKSVLFALLLFTPLGPLAPLAAAAASPEETYFAARDGYVAKFTAISGNLEEEIIEEHQRARDELGRLMQPIVGPVAIKGVLPDGRTNLDSLFKGDDSFGLLDGMLYSSADDKTHVIVTTDALFGHWLKEHKDWWGPKVANVPQDVKAALRSEAFYTQALLTDAAISKYAELPVARPAGATFAFAMLIARSQILGPRTPDQLMVAVVRGGRVFVVNAPANLKVAPLPACERLWQEATRKSAAALKAAAAAQSKGRKPPARFDRIEEEGDVAFHRCFAQRAKGQGFFAVLAKRAQGLVDLLPR